MGSPRRNQKKFERPAAMWNKLRIDSEHKLRDDYGLKNLHELWKATSEMRRIRRNVREVLSGKASEEVGKNVIARLVKFNIVGEGAVLDDLLVIKPEAMLERRLQTLVFRKGMAKTLKQSRQLIAHGFIAVNGTRAKSPSYLVQKGDEAGISYYKPFKIEQPAAVAKPAPEAAAGAATEAEAPKAA